MVNNLVAKKHKSGSERRRRTDPVNLRLLPSEARALRALAQDKGHTSVQALIVEILRPLITPCEQGEDRLTAAPTPSEPEKGTSSGADC